MESYRQMVLNAQKETAAAEQRQKEIRAGLGAVFQRLADARARHAVEDEARVAANKAHEAEMAAMDSEHAKKIEALQKQLDEAKQLLAAARSEKDYLHWSCQVHGIMSNLELAKQH